MSSRALGKNVGISQPIILEFAAKHGRKFATKISLAVLSRNGKHATDVRERMKSRARRVPEIFAQDAFSIFDKGKDQGVILSWGGE